MSHRAIVSALFVLAEVPGWILFAVPLVTYGMHRQSPARERIWGSLRRAPRAVFVAYFSGLGLLWTTTVQLIWNGAHGLAAWAVWPGAAAGLLLAGWLAALLHDGRSLSA